MKKIIFLLLLCVACSLQAQEKIEIRDSDYTNTEIDMADRFREEGKIYVVIAIFSVVLLGFIIYLIRIDRKVTRLEQKQEADRQTEFPNR